MSRTYADKVQKYVPFTFLEFRNIIITILLVGFMYGFNDGQPDFHLGYYSYNMILSIAIAAITIIVFLLGQRLAGISAGYRIEFQMWWPGLIVALIITFISRGYIWVPIVGGMVLHQMAQHRLGFFRYGLNMLDNAVIAACGPLANIFFATIIKQIAIWTPFIPYTPFIDKIYRFSLIFAVVNMLPIPPLAGSRVMYHSRLVFVFIFSFIAVYAILAIFTIFSWIIALIGAFVFWLLFYLKYES